MWLFEGNSGLAFVQDNWYGTVHFITLFRNHFMGDICSSYLSNGPSKSDQTWIMQIAAYSRFFNFVGNVLGRTGGTYTTYQPASYEDCTNASIWCLGYSHANGGVTDDEVRPRAMRWGNYDTVTAAVRWESSEVPSGIAQFANAVPSSQALPASMYLTAEPAWFGSVPYPAVGPDVTGGDISGYNGYANRIPARVCWESLSEDADFGSGYSTGQVRVFDRVTCYGS
jgi:hypothetical protein